MGNQRYTIWPTRYARAATKTVNGRAENPKFHAEAYQRTGIAMQNEGLDRLVRRAYMFCAGVLVFGWLLLWTNYPLVWAIVTGIMLVLLLGAFTARFIFQIRDTWKFTLLTPIFGLCCVALLWIVLKVIGH